MQIKKSGENKTLEIILSKAILLGERHLSKHGYFTLEMQIKNSSKHTYHLMNQLRPVETIPEGKVEC
jgi:hypothetical protein